jgi:sulfatase modifying factor 1
MKKLIVLASFIAVVTGCNKKAGELVGAEGREQWFQPDPFGTLYIPMGSYHMGPSDEEITMAHTAKSKMVSVQAFYIDDSEISNNEYRQFVNWVRDSIARKLLLNNGFEEDFGIPQDAFLQMWPEYIGDNNLQDPYLNWEEKIKWNSDEEDYRLALATIIFTRRRAFL